MADLDPKLQALQQRLTSAISDDSLIFNATTLGDDGSAIISLFQSAIGSAEVSLSGNISIAAEGTNLRVNADTLNTSILNINEGATRAYFSVVSNTLAIQLQTNAGTAWTFASSFPMLATGWPGSFVYDTSSDESTQVILASNAGTLINGTATLVEGINLKASLLLTSGSAQLITSLVTGMPSPLIVMGAASTSATLEQLNTNAPIQDFSITLPVLGALQFNGGQVSYYALNGELNGGIQYNAHFQASANVTLGGATLPLMMRVPYAAADATLPLGQGWTFGTIPGQGIAIADLATFFASLSGLDFLSALPTTVQTLTKFELSDLSMRLNKNFSDYNYLGATFATPEISADDNSWTIIAGTGADPLLKLTRLSLQLEVDREGTTNTLSGELAGSVIISNTLVLQCNIPLPISTSLWRFSAYSQQALPNLIDFTRFIGGRSLADLLPKKLGDLSSFNLDSLLITYNPGNNTFKNFSIGISTVHPWVIIEDWLSIEAIVLSVSLDDPLSSTSAVTGMIDGQIKLGTDTLIRVQVARAVATASWLLTVSTEKVVLPSLTDIATLANGDITPLLPEQIRTNNFTLSDVLIEADISNAKMQAFSFSLGTSDTWTVITDVLKITALEVSLDLSWQTATRETQGVIWGNVTFAQGDFYLQAAYANSNWTLQILLVEGSELTLENLAGIFSSTAWQSLSALGVPNIALKQAEMTYSTENSDYSFSGTIGPATGDKWQIPIGITNIDIESLGSKVTCTRASDGSASEKKIYVTGQFSVGSVQFNVSYLSGDNLTIDCALVGSDPILVKDMVTKLCNADAATVTWVSGFSALDSMTISNAHALLVLGDKPTFELYGKFSVEGVEVDCLFIVREIKSKWEFAFAIQIDVNWNLAGFTNVFNAFKLDSSTWMIAASSFTDAGFTFPSSFPTPKMAVIERGLDFYASFSTSNTLSTISTLQQALPSDTIAAEYTVHGLLADPLENSYLEVIISSSSDGVPLFGMQQVKLQSFSLRLKATPAFGLHGVFLFDSVKNPNGSTLSSGISVDFMISATDVSLNFGPPPGDDYIFRWEDAFGITALIIELDEVGFTFAWEPVAIGGNIAGQVTFEHSENPSNSLYKNAAPHPASVAYMHARRSLLLSIDANSYAYLQNIDYTRAYDQNGMVIKMATSFIIILAGEIPVPYPKKLAGHFVNMTLPYILDRFADITLPDVLMPIQFPDVKFYLELPDPEHIGVGSNIVFDFDGKLIIFGLHGEIAAHFDATRVMFSASMDPVLIPADGSLISITAENDKSKGVELYIDTQPPAGKGNIYGTFELDFFGMADLKGDIELLSATNPVNTKFKFHIQGHVGELANMNMTFIYQELDYLSASGGFSLNLTADGLSGFSMTKQGKTFQVADTVDFSKASSTGLSASATVNLTLDARNISNPVFHLGGDANATLNISSDCQLPIHLALDINVNKNTFTALPLTLAEQMVENGASVFGDLLSHAPQCFIDLLKLGVFVLAETEKVAEVLVEGFEMGVDLINEGAELLNDVGSTASDVASSLWNVFKSHSSKNNTSAMKHGGYNAKDTGEAIKQTQDKEEPHNPYTASNLVHDQATAGYLADHVVVALCDTFTTYTSKPVQAGQLLANQTLTSFNATHVTKALHTQYTSDTNTAAKMLGLLKQIYTGSASLSAQQMADALAPIYPAAEVASVLRQHYASDTDTAAKMAALLVSAYNSDGHPLVVADLASALAPLYDSVSVAAVLHTDFASETDTPLKLATILQTAYGTGSTALDATTMAKALAPIFTTASDIVSALKSLYATDTDTAEKMAVILIAAYPSINVSDMATALTTAQYPVADIAAVLKHYFGTTAGTPQQMTALLVAQHYTAVEVAPVLTALWPTECDTASKVATILIDGFPASSISVADMANALKAASFNAIAIAPALKTNYASDTTTASDMAALLISAFKDNDANTISASDMAKALAAASYVTNTDAGTAKALITNYASDTSTALAMSKLLNDATYSAANIAPALKEFYASSVASAANLASVFAATPFSAKISAPVIKTSFPSDVTTATGMYTVLSTAWSSPVLTVAKMAAALAASPYDISDTAPVLKTHYAADTTHASDMYGLLVAAYSNPVPDVTQMAGALAASPYSANEVAPLLKTNYPTDAGDATKLTPILKTAYTTIDLTNMMSALAAANFNALDIAAPTKAAYSSATVENMGQGLVAAYTGDAALTPLPLGTALLSASYVSGDIAKGIHAGLPDTSAGLMGAILLITADSHLSATISIADGFKQSGDTMAVAAPKVTAAVAGINGATLLSALGSVYMPPVSNASQLLNATVAAFATPDAGSCSEAALTFLPTTTDTALLSTLQAAYTAAGKTLSNADALTAVAEAFAFIGQPISQGDFGKLYIQLDSSATPADIATAIVTAYKTDATATTLVSALLTTYSGSTTLIDARVAAMAITPALGFKATDADKLLTPLATGFNLITCPNDVGVLGVALKSSGYSLNAVSAAMNGYWGTAWTPTAYQILASIYSKPVWTTAVTQRASGASITIAAPAIYTAHTDTDCALMVQVLAAVYDLSVTAEAISPMANALKVVVSANKKVYTLNEASAAMSAQYSPDWTPANWQQFQTIFNS